MARIILPFVLVCAFSFFFSVSLVNNQIRVHTLETSLKSSIRILLRTYSNVSSPKQTIKNTPAIANPIIAGEVNQIKKEILPNDKLDLVPDEPDGVVLAKSFVEDCGPNCPKPDERIHLDLENSMDPGELKHHTIGALHYVNNTSPTIHVSMYRSRCVHSNFKGVTIIAPQPAN